MHRFRIALLGGSLAWACLVVLGGAGVSRAEDKESALKAEIERQKKELEALKQRLDALASRSGGEAAAAAAEPALDESAVKGIVADYLAQQDKKKKEDEKAKPKAEDEGYKVGTF